MYDKVVNWNISHDPYKGSNTKHLITVLDLHVTVIQEITSSYYDIEILRILSKKQTLNCNAILQSVPLHCNPQPTDEIRFTSKWLQNNQNNLLHKALIDEVRTFCGYSFTYTCSSIVYALFMEDVLLNRKVEIFNFKVHVNVIAHWLTFIV